MLLHNGVHNFKDSDFQYLNSYLQSINRGRHDDCVLYILP